LTCPTITAILSKINKGKIMATPAKVNFIIYQGSTFNEVLRWESSRKVYKPITGITNAAPVIITSVGHGVPDGWRVRLTNIGGMKDLNSAADTYVNATVKTQDVLEINSINSIAYSPYTTGGIVEYNSPMDLAGYTARMQIRSKLGDPTFLLELTTENSRIILNNILKTIVIYISATDTAAITWTSGVYSLELISSTGIVSTLMNGSVTVKQEVTR
jgi:hypothetical protein